MATNKQDDRLPDPDATAEAAGPEEEATTAQGRQDPNDIVDVPDVMYPAELDARGDAVNSLREAEGLPVPKTDDQDRGARYA